MEQMREQMTKVVMSQIEFKKIYTIDAVNILPLARFKPGEITQADSSR